jgi:hypothetical protein
MEIEENALEQALRLAAKEPAHRPEFYRALLESTVFVIGSSDSPPEGHKTLDTGAKVQLQNWQKADGTLVIPFFSSLAMLQRAIEGEVNYIALPAKSLFEMTRGASLVLNPRSDYGKEFFSNEIEALLSNGVNRVPTQRVVEKATKVLLGQPKNYPSEMIAALTILLSKHSNVKMAYLALMHDPSVDEKPHLVVGIEGEGDFENAIREAGAVAGDTSPGGEPVDFMRINRGESGLSRYFIEEVKPFYERKWGSKLKSIIGIGRA